MNLNNLDRVITKCRFVDSLTEFTQPTSQKFDGIFHLGIYSSSPMYRDKPSLVGAAVNDFIEVMNVALQSQAKIVFASTSSIYSGNPQPFKESMMIQPSDLYTETRYYIERLANLYCQLYGLNSIGLRLFSVYGPDEDSKGIYANIIYRILKSFDDDDQPTLYGDATVSRDFIHVEDVVRAFVLAMQAEEGCGIVNVGTGVSTNIHQLVQIVNEETGKNLSPIYVKPPFPNYLRSTLADCVKAQSVLGFQTAIPIKEGIREAILQRKQKVK
jgi:UDP-glucose 4-epimerase